MSTIERFHCILMPLSVISTNMDMQHFVKNCVAMGVNFKEIDNEQTRSTETQGGVTMRCDKEVWQRGVARCGKEV